MCPGRARSSARVAASITRAPSCCGRRRRCRWSCRAFASTDTVNAVRCCSLFSRPDDHQRELQLVEARALERQADDAARVADHERHLLGRHLLGRDDEVAFVLAIFVVDHDDELAAFDGVDRCFDLVEGHGLAARSLLDGCSQPLDVLGDDVDFEVHGARPARRTPSVVTASVCGITAIGERRRRRARRR